MKILLSNIVTDSDVSVSCQKTQQWTCSNQDTKYHTREVNQNVEREKAI